MLSHLLQSNLKPHLKVKHAVNYKEKLNCADSSAHKHSFYASSSPLNTWSCWFLTTCVAVCQSTSSIHPLYFMADWWEPISPAHRVRRTEGRGEMNSSLKDKIKTESLSQHNHTFTPSVFTSWTHHVDAMGLSVFWNMPRESWISYGDSGFWKLLTVYFLI